MVGRKEGRDKAGEKEGKEKDGSGVERKGRKTTSVLLPSPGPRLLPNCLNG